MWGLHGDFLGVQHGKGRGGEFTVKSFKHDLSQVKRSESVINYAYVPFIAYDENNALPLWSSSPKPITLV